MTKKLLWFTIFIIFFSPIVYFSTGIGQHAAELSAKPIVAADGSLENSPKSEALHDLTLPIRVEKLVVYPLLLLLFQFSGASLKLRQWLDEKTKRVFGAGKWASITTAILFIAIITTGITLIYTPFSIYGGFILRHQFGLSHQSFGAWLKDFGTGWGINLLTTIILYGGFYALMAISPRRWVIWAGFGFALFTFGYILLEPIVITPLFYKIEPLSDVDLHRRITTMADRAGVVIDDISIIDASAKTSTVNAYFTGFGKASKIVLWDTLLLQHTPDEVDVVIAHEMGHWVHKHLLLYAMGGSAGLWLGLFVLRWWLDKVWRKLGWRSPRDVAGYPYLLGIIALISALALPVENSISRIAENQADDFALAISQKPEAATALFERFAVENISRINVPTWEKIIFYTHPPLSERIAKSKHAAENLTKN